MKFSHLFFKVMPKVFFSTQNCISINYGVRMTDKACDIICILSVTISNQNGKLPKAHFNFSFKDVVIF